MNNTCDKKDQEDEVDMMEKKVTHNPGRKRAVSFEININIHQ